MRLLRFSALALVYSSACTGDTVAPSPGGEPAPELGCGAVTDIRMSPGEASTFGPAASSACFRFPSVAQESEYIAVVYSAGRAIAPEGVHAPYRVRTRHPGATVAAVASNPEQQMNPGPGDQLHTRLRHQEQALAVRHRSAPAAVRRSIPPPGIGEQRMFGVCATPSCVEFVPVRAATVRVGQQVVLMLDTEVDGRAFASDQLDRLTRLFDENLHPIATEAFGAESDVDGNGTVFVLLTAQVNRLCPALGGVATGYFYGLDLLPGEPGSNQAEVFYALVPDPEGAYGCRVSHELVERELPVTFIHEFQHMISFNQHVLSRGGLPEESWLNEGLSHLAEELAGRRVPNTHCQLSDCLSQFAFNGVSNAYQYLFATEDSYLVYPANSTGVVAERGAAYLFVRWLSDHYGQDALIRSLVRTGRTGAANVEAVTGRDFGTLLGEWHLANYLDDLPGYTSSNPRLRYAAWNLRVTFSSLRDQFPWAYPRRYPLDPELTWGTYSHAGTLRGGSGRHLRIVVPAQGLPIDLRADDGTAAPGSFGIVSGSIAIGRIR